MSETLVAVYFGAGFLAYLIVIPLLLWRSGHSWKWLVAVSVIALLYLTEWAIVLLAAWPIVAPLIYFSERSAHHEETKWQAEVAESRKDPYAGMSLEEKLAALKSKMDPTDPP